MGNSALRQESARPAPRGKGKPALRGARRPLPDLVPYRGAPQARTRTPASIVKPGPTVAAIPTLPPPRRRAVEDKPFAPVGLSAGSLRLFPYIEGNFGSDTNPNRTATTPKASTFWRGEAGLDLNSEWTRHDLRATLRGGYTDYLSDRNASRPDGSGAANARVDVTRDTTILIDGKFNLDTQRPTSPEITALGTRGATVDGRPSVISTGAGLGWAQRFGGFETTLRGTIDRVAYGDAKLSDGSTLVLSGQSYNAVGASLRGAYEVTPGVKPFVEVFTDLRRHDDSFDASGFARNSKEHGARAGSSFEMSRVLTGEASAGWSERRYDDARLGKLRGPIIDAQLVWTASALTTMTLKASTLLAETNVAGSSGSIVRRGGVDISHALLRDLTLGASLVYQDTAYQGTGLNEKLLSAGLRAEYNLSRSVVLRGSFTHERLKSSAANADYTANVYLLGLRFQR